jgi:hypothetical protein
MTSPTPDLTDTPRMPLTVRPSPGSGLPRLPAPPFQRAMPTTPADRNGCICRLLPHPARPSPNLRRVGIHDFTFEACSGFTLVTARWIAQPPKGGLCHEAPAQPVTQPSRSSATRSNRQLSGWILLPLVLRYAPFGAHVESRTGAVVVGFRWTLAALSRGRLSPACRDSVSRPRSSNATGRFPALRSPTDFTSELTAARQYGHGVTEERQASRTRLDPKSEWCRATTPCGAG